MRSEVSYSNVFSSSTDLNVWPQIGFILKKTDTFLERVRPSGNKGSERFLKTKRQYLSFITISRLLGKFDFSINEIINFDIGKYEDHEMMLSWKFLEELDSDTSAPSSRKKSYLHRLVQAASVKWKIKNVERITRGKQPMLGNIERPILKSNKEIVVTKEFAHLVNSILPPQPWKPGVDREVVDKLECTRQEYFVAVRILIEEGLRYRQKDGVVYDEEGNVLMFDEERVNSETMKLYEYE